MLLGLHFRPHLTSSEKDILPLLVGESAKVCLRLGGNYIHNDASEAPIDAVPTNQVTGTDAMFTHRWRPDRADLTDARILRTARIGRIDGQDLMLGLIEADCEPDRDLADIRFTPLIDIFRQAMTDASAVARHLHSRLPESGAWMLINRASGRVLALGRQAGVLLNAGEAYLVGQEYSSLTDSLGRVALERGLKLDNIEVHEQHLTIVTILPRQSVPAAQESDRFFSEFFAHMMRNKLSTIVSAAGHLGTLAAEREEAEECEVADIIQSQADELDRQIERFRVLLDYDQLQPKTTSLASMIRDTVERLEKSGLHTKVTIPREQAEAEWKVSPIAGDLLLEAIVLSQNTSDNGAARTQIRISARSQPLSIEITTRRSNDQAPARFRSDWQDYARRLASVMSLRCEYHRPDEKTLITVITPTADRK
jgi:cell fate (sporulation/competence/biofilm development) regulator YmcA (YheA/YmcA/DUF963 family)